MKIVPITESNGQLAGFNLFWSVYPRKEAKLDAMRAWEATKRIHPPIEEMVAAVNKYSRLCTDREFTALPATWLRAGRWMDE